MDDTETHNYFAQVDVGFGTVQIDDIQADSLRDATVIALDSAVKQFEKKRKGFPEKNGHDYKLRVWREY
jgi:hypothetical protein